MVKWTKGQGDEQTYGYMEGGREERRNEWAKKLAGQSDDGMNWQMGCAGRSEGKWMNQWLGAGINCHKNIKKNSPICGEGRGRKGGGEGLRNGELLIASYHRRMHSKLQLKIELPFNWKWLSWHRNAIQLWQKLLESFKEWPVRQHTDALVSVGNFSSFFPALKSRNC